MCRVFRTRVKGAEQGHRDIVSMWVLNAVFGHLYLCRVLAVLGILGCGWGGLARRAMKGSCSCSWLELRIMSIFISKADLWCP